MAWANAWHALGAADPGSEEYNAALQAITERFAGRNARSGRGCPNGSAINAVRTNEIDFGSNGLWELREFVLSPTTGMLVPATVKLTPDLGVQLHEQRWRRSSTPTRRRSSPRRTTVPEQFQGAPFLAGAVFNDFFTAVARARASTTTRRGTSSR